jgi:hypothetical protein
MLTFIFRRRLPPLNFVVVIRTTQMVVPTVLFFARRLKSSVLFFFEDKIEREADVFCVLQGADLVGAVYSMVKVKGLPPGWAKNNNVVSAETFLLAPAADIDFAASELIIPDGADIQVNPFLYDISYTRLCKH